MFLNQEPSENIMLIKHLLGDMRAKNDLMRAVSCNFYHAFVHQFTNHKEYGRVFCLTGILQFLLKFEYFKVFSLQKTFFFLKRNCGRQTCTCMYCTYNDDL